MNKEEIREALRIIKEPITVNTTTYHYFDQENYDKLQSVYDNCQWFINNAEQLIQNIEYQQQELERYKNIIDELEIYLQRKYGEYIDMESDDAFVISLVLDTLRELKGE